MEDRLETLIHSKEWNELTEEEKNYVEQHTGSREEYEALRKITLRLSDVPRSEVTPAPDTLPSLKRHFRSTRGYRLGFASVFTFQVPAYAAGLILISAVAITWWFANPVLAPQPAAAVIVKTDTVFVNLPADTVYVNKVIYRYLPSPGAPAKPVTVVKHTEGVGVSMKDKEELENLLVSGSD
ncbi:MAG TPA: hypothetical protein VEB86_16605 [Chryseosolibacter sp.]|nr:hypothetical protein [Chryseosolibacter sp.]